MALSPTTVPDNKHHCDLCLPKSAKYYDSHLDAWYLHRRLLCEDLTDEHEWKERSHGSGA